MAARRGRQTPGDMVRSLAVVFALVLAGLLIGPARTLLFPGHQRLVTVDAAQAVREARRLAGHPLLAPVGLPAGWRATSVRVGGGHGTPVTLHIGYLTPHTQYLALEETDGPSAAFVAAVTGGFTPGPPVLVGGQAWASGRADGGRDHALVRRDGAITVVITGSAGAGESRQLAAALRLG